MGDLLERIGSFSRNYAFAFGLGLASVLQPGCGDPPPPPQDAYTQQVRDNSVQNLSASQTTAEKDAFRDDALSQSGSYQTFTAPLSGYGSIQRMTNILHALAFTPNLLPVKSQRIGFSNDVGPGSAARRFHDYHRHSGGGLVEEANLSHEFIPPLEDHLHIENNVNGYTGLRRTLHAIGHGYSSRPRDLSTFNGRVVEELEAELFALEAMPSALVGGWTFSGGIPDRKKLYSIDVKLFDDANDLRDQMDQSLMAAFVRNGFDAQGAYLDVLSKSDTQVITDQNSQSPDPIAQLNQLEAKAAAGTLLPDEVCGFMQQYDTNITDHGLDLSGCGSGSP